MEPVSYILCAVLRILVNSTFNWTKDLFLNVYAFSTDIVQEHSAISWASELAFDTVSNLEDITNKWSVFNKVSLMILCLAID